MRKLFLLFTAILAVMLVSCSDDNTYITYVTPQPSEDAVVLNQLYAEFLGDAVDGKTASLKMAFFNGAYGADVEGMDYEVFVLSAINDMPERFDSFKMKPGKYTFADTYSGVAGEFVGGSVVDGMPQGSYYSKMKDGVLTTYLITGGEANIVKSAGDGYVMAGNFEGAYYNDEQTRMSAAGEGLEVYYSGSIAFENKDIPEGAIVLKNFNPEYFGDQWNTGGAFMALSFYNGEIDFQTGGPVGAYELFMMEAFNTVYDDVTMFQVDPGVYEFDHDATGLPFTIHPGYPEGSSYYGTFYRKRDEAGVDTDYMLTGGSVTVRKYGESYKVLAEVNGYIVNPDDLEDDSNSIEDVVFYYWGPMPFDIKPVKPFKMNDGEGMYWGDEGTGSGKTVLNLRYYDVMGDIMYHGFGITMYVPTVPTSNPNSILEVIPIPEGRYNLSDTKAPYTFEAGGYVNQYTINGTYYYELGHDTSTPPQVMAAITSGYLTVTHVDDNIRVDTYFKGKDFSGNDCVIEEWWYEGPLPVTDKRVIEKEELRPEFTKASMVYKGIKTDEGTSGQYGRAILTLTSDEIAYENVRYELKMEIWTHPQDPNGTIILTPIDYGKDPMMGSFGRFVPGSTIQEDKSWLNPSYYKQITEDGKWLTASVIVKDGTMGVMEGRDGYTIMFNLEGENLRTERKAEISGSYSGPVDITVDLD